MDECPTVELGVSTTHLKKKEKKIAHVLQKQRSKKRKDGNMSSKRSKFYYHLYIITITIIYSTTHAHLDLIIC